MQKIFEGNIFYKICFSSVNQTCKLLHQYLCFILWAFNELSTKVLPIILTDCSIKKIFASTGTLWKTLLSQLSSLNFESFMPKGQNNFNSLLSNYIIHLEIYLIFISQLLRSLKNRWWHIRICVLSWLYSNISRWFIFIFIRWG